MLEAQSNPIIMFVRHNVSPTLALYRMSHMLQLNNKQEILVQETVSA